MSNQKNASVPGGVSATQKRATKKTGGSDDWMKTNGGKIAICCVGAVLVGVIVVGILLFSNRGKDGGGEVTEVTESTVAGTNELTEEEKDVTKETLDKYTEVTVEGYQKVDDNEISSDVVVVNVKNISNERTSLAIVVAAEDGDGNVLDTSSLYAEGIMPGETQRFELFVYSEMTVDQMKNAKYVVYKANTYETPNGNSGEEVVVTDTTSESEAATTDNVESEASE